MNLLHACLWAPLLINLVGARSITGDGDKARVRFVVVTPDDASSASETIHLADSRDAWNPAGRTLTRVATGLYEGAWEMPPGESEYKFTRDGTWQTVEKASEGGEIPNRRLTVQAGPREQVLVHVVARWADHEPQRSVEVAGAPVPAASEVRKSTRSGDIRVHADVESPQLNNRRTVLVYLPPGYDASKEARYPVLYLHDGNNAFDVATSSNGVEWAADETAERLTREKKIRPLILVAIYNTPDRMNEYAPVRDKGINAGGRGDAYVAFIADTLKPLIDRTYRTKPGRADTAIAGSSLGGLISLYAVYKRPEVFGAAAALSPSLFWGNRQILEFARAAPPDIRPRLWIDIGTGEAAKEAARIGTNPLVADCRELAEILKKRGHREGVDLRLEVIDGGQHHERDWAQRFDRVLEFLYGLK